MFRRYLVLASFALGLPAAVQARPAAPVETVAPPDTAERRLEQEFATFLLASRPDLAVRYGVAGAQDALVPFHDDALDHDVAWLTAFAARLDRSDVHGQRADSLRARVVRARDESVSGGALRSDAGAWLVRAITAAHAPLDVERISPCERARQVGRLLLAFPEFLRSASLVLRGASPPSDASVSAAIETLRVVLPARLDECRDSHRMAWFVEADSAAARAVMRFTGWLDTAAGTPAR